MKNFFMTRTDKKSIKFNIFRNQPYKIKSNCREFSLVSFTFVNFVFKPAKRDQEGVSRQGCGFHRWRAKIWEAPYHEIQISEARFGNSGARKERLLYMVANTSEDVGKLPIVSKKNWPNPGGARGVHKKNREAPLFFGRRLCWKNLLIWPLRSWCCKRPKIKKMGISRAILIRSTVGVSDIFSKCYPMLQNFTPCSLSFGYSSKRNSNSNYWNYYGNVVFLSNANFLLIDKRINKLSRFLSISAPSAKEITSIVQAN